MVRSIRTRDNDGDTMTWGTPTRKPSSTALHPRMALFQNLFAKYVISDVAQNIYSMDKWISILIFLISINWISKLFLSNSYLQLIDQETKWVSYVGVVSDLYL